MLVTCEDMLKLAYSTGRAIPSPDFVDSNSVRAFVRTAEELNAPIILSFAEVHQDHLSLEEAADLGLFYAKRATVPVALHLDHGTSLETVQKAIDLGFTSVMIDASAKSLQDNIAITRDVTQLAHEKGITVEAEIGHVGSEDDSGPHGVSDQGYTEVSAAEEMLRETGVDMLAVAVGTAHGKYKGTPHINFQRLQELNEALHLPLVLHGGSGTGDENLSRCAKLGVCKVNLYTDFIVSALDAVYEQHPDHWLTLLHTSDEAMSKVLAHYYKVLGW